MRLRARNALERGETLAAIGEDTFFSYFFVMKEVTVGILIQDGNREVVNKLVGG